MCVANENPILREHSISILNSNIQKHSLAGCTLKIEIKHSISPSFFTYRTKCYKMDSSREFSGTFMCETEKSNNLKIFVDGEIVLVTEPAAEQELWK